MSQAFKVKKVGRCFLFNCSSFAGLSVIEWVYSLADELRLLISRDEVERFRTSIACDVSCNV